MKDKDVVKNVGSISINPIKEPTKNVNVIIVVFIGVNRNVLVPFRIKRVLIKNCLIFI